MRRSHTREMPFELAGLDPGQAHPSRSQGIFRHQGRTTPTHNPKPSVIPGSAAKYRCRDIADVSHPFARWEGSATPTSDAMREGCGRGTAGMRRIPVEGIDYLCGAGAFVEEPSGAVATLDAQGLEA